MQLSDLQLLRQLGSGIVGFTAFVVLALALWLWSSASGMPESTQAAQSFSHRRIINSPNRAIASVPDLSHDLSHDQTSPIDIKAETKVDAKIETVAIGCLKNLGHFEVQSTASHVRLKMASCQGSPLTLENSHLINVANGYEGTLFNLENGGFSSDYIHLVDGENKLTVQIEDLKGHMFASEVTIFRRPGS